MYKIYATLIIAILAAQISANSATAQANTFSQFVDSDVGIKSSGEHGWLPVSNVEGNKAFYWFVKNTANVEKAPLFIMVPNGSGKSILVSYFTSWGQQIISKHSEGLHDNHKNLNQYADLLMIDIPIGTGFSVYSDPSQIPTTLGEKTAHFSTFIKNFMDGHGELRGREIYVVSELRGTQSTPAFAYKLAKSGFNVKGVISFSNLSNPWINHLSYVANMEYKRIIKKGDKMYNTFNHNAKLCNLFSVLGAPNAEHYCSTLGDDADQHVLDIFNGSGVALKNDTNTRLKTVEKKIERWLNTERVQKYFNVRAKFYAVDMAVFNTVTQSDNRNMSTDAILTALLNRKIAVYYIVGSLERTANWIGNLMSATRLKWVGQESFGKAKWELWNRKNDLKQFENLHFSRVFGRDYKFWQQDATEIVKFVNEYILQKVPTRAEKKHLTEKTTRQQNVSSVNKVEEENGNLQIEQEELIKKTVVLERK